nr:hypothetical protein [Burkholderia sp. Ac-20365]
MYHWRKLFIVVLLILSLPVQSLAAVSMKCGPGEASEDKASHAHMAHVLLSSDHHSHATPGLERAHPDGHHHGGAQHAHACSTCASCCFGAAMLSVPVMPASVGFIHFFTPPPAAPVVSFLTGGIERPPRSTLV